MTHHPNGNTQTERPRTGEETGPGDVIPQGTVQPGTGELDAKGPQDWDDLIVHTGEARGVADTAYHSLEPDAPTVGAARRGKTIAETIPPGGGQPAYSDNAPD